ncbi:MAG: response regulator [bacterium]|nr:response regulator [bacterium]
MDDETQSVILAVDDNPQNLGLLFNYLDLAGFTVLLVRESQSVVGHVEENLPDLILLDIMMPGLNGFEVCRLLKENSKTRDIPVIFMTARSGVEDKVRGFEVGGVDFVTKPIQYKEVLARVKTHITIRKLQKQLEEKNDCLEKQREEFSKLNASKDRFFSILSHDLRAPFTGLCGMTEILIEHFNEYQPSEVKKSLQKFKKTTDNLYSLIENLLTWSGIQSGKIDFKPQMIPLIGSFANLLQLFSSNAEQKQIHLKNSLEKPFSVYADVRMLDTVLRNLMSNALKFTHPEGSITISAVQEDRMLRISVADTGLGIDPKYHDKLFRIDTEYKCPGTAGEHGTGLGLVLCKEFVEQQGGTIRIESTVGVGSVFSFTLPMEAGDAP